MPANTVPQNTETSGLFRLYATIDADKVMATQNPAYVAAQTSIPRPNRAIIVLGASGNLKVTTLNDAEITLPLASNVVYPISVKKLISSGSTVTNVLVLW